MKLDFDLEDSFEENDDFSNDSEYKDNKINTKSKKIILDEDNEEIKNKNMNNKSKKGKRSKNSKRDISLKSEVVYLENNNK